MSEKFEATFHPGRPLPERTPFQSFAAWGEPPPPDEVPGLDDRTVYSSPGRPPWAPPERRQGVPAWAWVSIAVGLLFGFCGMALALVHAGADTDPVAPASPVVERPVGAPVSVTGECRKRIIGSYAFIATVTARNATEQAQAGEVWVSWPVTGEAARTFGKKVTLVPGQSVEFPVSETVTAETWFQAGECRMGWTAD